MFDSKLGIKMRSKIYQRNEIDGQLIMSPDLDLSVNKKL